MDVGFLSDAWDEEYRLKSWCLLYILYITLLAHSCLFTCPCKIQKSWIGLLLCKLSNPLLLLWKSVKVLLGWTDTRTIDTFTSVFLCAGTTLSVFNKGSDPVCWRLVPVSSFFPAVRFRLPNNRGEFFFFLLGSPVKWLLSHCSLVTLHCNPAHPCMEETEARQEEALIAQAISSPFVWTEHAWFPGTVAVKRALKSAPRTGAVGCEEGRFQTLQDKKKYFLKCSMVAYRTPHLARMFSLSVWHGFGFVIASTFQYVLISGKRATPTTLTPFCVLKIKKGGLLCNRLQHIQPIMVKLTGRMVWRREK